MTLEPRYKQKPITRSEQLPCLVPVLWRFHKTVYFKNDFGANLEYLLGPTNLSAKAKGLKMTFSFPLSYLILLIMRS